MSTPTKAAGPGTAPEEQAAERVARTRSASLRDRARVGRDRLRRGPAPAVMLGVAAGAWAAVIGLAIVLLPMLAAWIASPHSGLTWPQALRLAGTMWGVAQTAPVTVGEVTYTLTPWGFALGSALLVAHATAWAGRRCPSGRSRWPVIPGAVVAYGALASVVALVAGGPAVRVDPVSAAIHAGGVALVGAALALLGTGPAPWTTPGSRPGWGSWLVSAARAGAAAAFVILGVAAVLVAVAIAVRLDDAATIASGLGAGPVGGLVVLLLGLGYLPVAIGWAAAYLLGAGIVVGPAVTVSPFVAVTGSTLLPPFPLLAAVPTSAGPLAWLLPTVGVLAGAVAALVVVRADRRAPRLVRAAVAAASAVVAGLLLAGVAALSAGSLGDLRLAQVGPAPLAVGVLAMIAVALGAVPLAALAPVAERPRLRVAAVDSAATLGPAEPAEPTESVEPAPESEPEPGRP